MKYSNLAITILFAITATKIQSESLPEELLRLSCFAHDDLTVFDLRALQKHDGYYTYVVNPTSNNQSQPQSLRVFRYNFCEPLGDSCIGDPDVWAVETETYFNVGVNKDDDLTQCTQLSGTNLIDSIKHSIVVDRQTDQRHVVLTYTNGDICPYSGVNNTFRERYQISFEFKCNKQAKGSLGTPVFDETDRCKPKLIYETEHGCPVFSATTWIRFLNEYPQILSGFLMVFGVLAIFKGKELFEFTIGIFGASVTFFSLMVVFSSFEMLEYLSDPDDEEFWLMIAAFALALLLSITVGFILVKAGWLIGVMTLGMGIGFIFGLTIYNLIFFNTGFVWLWVVLSVGGAIVFGMQALKYNLQLMIFGTSFLGSYSLVRGIGMLPGYFPNEAQLYAELQIGIAPQVNWRFYVYLVAILVFTVLGSAYQLRCYRKANQHRH